MAKERRSFADDLESTPDDKASKGIQYTQLEDKWNVIQEDYINAHPELDMEDLYFESGGFEGLLEKISEVRNKSVEEVRSEIQQWK
jgi:hypothetical protein